MRTVFIKAVFVLLILVSPVKVWAIDKLTEENIREHYQKFLEIVKEKKRDKFLSFMQTHYHPDLIMTFTYPIAGKDGTLSESFQDKRTRQQIINRFLTGLGADAEFLEYDLVSVSISNYGQSAEVRIKTKVSCGANCSNFVVVTECNDQFILSPEGIIQYYKAACGWVVPEEFKKKQPQ